MTELTKFPKVFISYAWEDDIRAWVRDLATRLRSDGVDTILDQWEVALGDSLPEFMENSVSASNFVLVICTPAYKSKSDSSDPSGVGYEKGVITGELFVKRNQRKFIPVLRKGKWLESAPSWVLGKNYIDLHGTPYSEENYQGLLRTLYDKREQPPPIGKPPDFFGNLGDKKVEAVIPKKQLVYKNTVAKFIVALKTVSAPSFRLAGIIIISTILFIGSWAITRLASFLLPTKASMTLSANAIPTLLPSSITNAAKTVLAELTLTAASFTATPLPPTETPTPELPTATATQAFTTNLTLAALGTPVALCGDYSFILTTLDVTIPDGTTLTANQDFVKTWKIKNTGICTWDTGYGLIFSYGEKMSGKPVPLSVNVAPDQEVDVSLNLKAPGKAGSYVSAWQMANPKGIPFGDKEHILLVKIVVQ